MTGSNEPGQTTRRTRISSLSSLTASAGARRRRRDRTRASSRRSGGTGPRVKPAGQAQRAADRVARSTTTSAPGASQPWSAQRGEHAATSACRQRVGRVEEDHVVRRVPAGPRPSDAARPGSRSSRGAGQADAPRCWPGSRWRPRRSDSTSRTSAAPRDSASSPTAPEPAYRSSTRRAASAPSAARAPRRTAPPRTRSLVGRVRRRAGRQPAAAGGARR